MSSSFSIRRAPAPPCPGTPVVDDAAGSNSSAHTSLGNEKWAEWSAVQVADLASADLEREFAAAGPVPPSTPSHDVTSAVICWLAVISAACPGAGRCCNPAIGLGPPSVRSGSCPTSCTHPSDEANALIASDPMALLVGFVPTSRSVQKAFSGPLALKERLGSIDAATLHRPTSSRSFRAPGDPSLPGQHGQARPRPRSPRARPLRRRMPRASGRTQPTRTSCAPTSRRCRGSAR